MTNTNTQAGQFEPDLEAPAINPLMEGAQNDRQPQAAQKQPPQEQQAAREQATEQQPQEPQQQQLPQQEQEAAQEQPPQPQQEQEAAQEQTTTQEQQPQEQEETQQPQAAQEQEQQPQELPPQPQQEQEAAQEQQPQELQKSAPVAQGFSPTGSSRIMSAINMTLRRTEDLPRYVDRFNEVQRAARKGKTLAIAGVTDKTSLDVELALSQQEWKIAVLTQKFADTRTADTYCKILSFLYEKLTPIAHNQASFVEYDGKLGIYFTAKEIADKGIYKDKRYAKEGIKQLKGALLAQRVEYSYTPKNKKRVQAQSLCNMFIALHSHAKGAYFLDVNTELDWKLLLQNIHRLPDYYYALPAKPAALTSLIAQQIDCNKTQIKERGYIVISYRTIQRELDLPDEKKTLRHTQLIVQPIIDAITAIQNKQKEREAELGYGKLEELQRIEDNTGNITQWLDNSRLKVTLHGAWHDEYLKLAAVKENKIAAARKRQFALKKAREAKAATQEK